MKANAAVRLQLSSEKYIAPILNSLAPETRMPITTRAKVVLDSEGNFLVLRVQAKDTVALRAALNSYLRWIMCAAKVLEVVKHTS